MREVVPEIARWRARGDIVATATIVGIGGSSPRELGALLAVNQRGEEAGSLSGGLDGAVSMPFVWCSRTKKNSTPPYS